MEAPSIRPHHCAVTEEIPYARHTAVEHTGRTGPYPSPPELRRRTQRVNQQSQESGTSDRAQRATWYRTGDRSGAGSRKNLLRKSPWDLMTKEFTKGARAQRDHGAWSGPGMWGNGYDGDGWLSHYVVSDSCDPHALDPTCTGSPVHSGSSVHWMLQTRVLEHGVISASRGSSTPKDRTCVSCIGRRDFFFFLPLSHQESPSSVQSLSGVRLFVTP